MRTVESPAHWRKLFETWPDNVERKGSVISKFGETVSFDDFMLTDGLLILARNAPDASGARKAILAFDAIAIVKLPTTMELAEFKSMGFRAVGNPRRM